MNFQMTPVPDYREECQGEGSGKRHRQQNLSVLDRQ